jgi:hypothetical protein
MNRALLTVSNRGFLVNIEEYSNVSVRFVGLNLLLEHVSILNIFSVPLVFIAFYYEKNILNYFNTTSYFSRI